MENQNDDPMNIDGEEEAQNNEETNNNEQAEDGEELSLFTQLSLDADEEEEKRNEEEGTITEDNNNNRVEEMTTNNNEQKEAEDEEEELSLFTQLSLDADEEEEKRSEEEGKTTDNNKEAAEDNEERSSGTQIPWDTDSTRDFAGGVGDIGGESNPKTSEEEEKRNEEEGKTTEDNGEAAEDNEETVCGTQVSWNTDSTRDFAGGESNPTNRNVARATIAKVEGRETRAAPPSPTLSSPPPVAMVEIPTQGQQQEMTRARGDRREWGGTLRGRRDRQTSRQIGERRSERLRGRDDTSAGMQTMDLTNDNNGDNKNHDDDNNNNNNDDDTKGEE